jgi:hypothetical protein
MTCPFAYVIKCSVSLSAVRIHLAMPLCRSEIKVFIFKPDVFKWEKHLFAPASSIALLLPVSLAYKIKSKFLYTANMQTCKNEKFLKALV